MHGPGRRPFEARLRRAPQGDGATASHATMTRYRVTVDTGGTFSDFVYLAEATGEVTITKVA